MRQFRAEAAAAMKRADVAGSVQRALKASGGVSPVVRAMAAFSSGLNLGVSLLSGMSVGQAAKQVERYGRSSSPDQQRMARAFLRSLGPVGELISLLSGLSGKRANSATNSADVATILLQAMGQEITPARRSRRRAQPTLAASDLLNAMADITGEPPPDLGLEEPPATDDRGGTRRPPMRRGGGGEGGGGGPNDPTFTGEMQPGPEDSNVYSYGYNSDTANLYVRFRNEKTEGPGSLYRYSGVTIPEFRSLMSAASKGGWVWDHLRIRGTVTGHKKDYALVGIVGGYVPRKATVAPLKVTPAGGWRMAGPDETPDYEGAVYLPRQHMTTQRNWVTSIKPLSPAFGGLDSGGPSRGTPNRGSPRRPNRG
jgi:hypothetical protein